MERQFTDEQRKDVIERYKNGQGSTKIHTITGIPKRDVLRWLKEEGVFRPVEYYTEEEKEGMLREYAENKIPVKEVAEKYGTTMGYLCNLARKHGLTRSFYEAYDTEEITDEGNIKEYSGAERNFSMDCLTEVSCSWCGKNVMRYKGDVEKRTNIFFCTSKCRELWNSENLNGKNNPSFVNGSSYGKYCEKFNDFLKRRVRAYMGNECILCGKTKKENRGRDMSVHHVYDNKMVCCNDDDRVKFAPICMSCHKHIEGSEIYRDALHRMRFVRKWDINR